MKACWAAGMAGLVVAATGCSPQSGSGTSLNRGAGIYFRHCATCHGEDGAPTIPACPPLKGSEWLDGEAAPLIAVVLDGARGPLGEGGQIYQGVMPAWRGVLTDGEIADVLTFLRAEFGGRAPPVPEKEVEALRERTKMRQAFWTQGELRAL